MWYKASSAVWLELWFKRIFVYLGQLAS
jgi:hypothetical protein